MPAELRVARLPAPLVGVDPDVLEHALDVPRATVGGVRLVGDTVDRARDAAELVAGEGLQDRLLHVVQVGAVPRPTGRRSAGTHRRGCARSPGSVKISPQFDSSIACTHGFSSTIRRKASNLRKPEPSCCLMRPSVVGQMGHLSWQMVDASRPIVVVSRLGSHPLGVTCAASHRNAIPREFSRRPRARPARARGRAPGWRSGGHAGEGLEVALGVDETAGVAADRPHGAVALRRVAVPRGVRSSPGTSYTVARAATSAA